MVCLFFGKPHTRVKRLIIYYDRVHDRGGFGVEGSGVGVGGVEGVGVGVGRGGRCLVLGWVGWRVLGWVGGGGCWGWVVGGVEGGGVGVWWGGGCWSRGGWGGGGWGG